MKIKIYLFIIILLYSGFIRAQNICLNIDSVVVYMLPQNLNTTLSLQPYDVRNFDDNIKCKYNFTDTSTINLFELVLNESDTLLKRNATIENIDARIVIDIYLQRNIKITLSMHHYYNYFYNKNIYNSNINLIRFLEVMNKVCPPTKFGGYIIPRK